MSRFNDQLTVSALSADKMVSVDLVRISFGCTNANYATKATCELNGETWTDDILMTTFVNDISADVDGTGTIIFQSSNELLNISEVEESLGMDIGTMSIDLLAISSQWLLLSQTIEVTNRPVELWRVLLDPNTLNMVGAPVKYFSGVIVSGTINKVDGGDGSSVTIEVSNELYNFQVVSGFRANVDDHQKFFPLDTGFKNTSSITKKLVWGETK